MTVLVLMAWFGYRLSEGPVSLSFLSPYIQDALSDPHGGFAVTLDQTVLAWSRETRTLEIRAEGVRAVAGEQGVIAAVPELLVSLSGSALLRGQIAPRRLAFRHPSLRLVRDAAGHVQVGVGEGTDAGGNSSPAISDAFQALLAPPDFDSPSGQLRRVDIENADLLVLDMATGVTWHAPRADLRFFRDQRGISGWARFELVLDGEPAHIDMDGLYVSAGRDVQTTLSFSGIRPAGLAGLLPQIPQLTAFQLPTGGSVGVRYNLDRGIDSLRFDLVAGEGVIDASTWQGVSWPVRSVALHGALTDGLTTANIDELRIDLGDGLLSASGKAANLSGAMTLDAEAKVDDLPVELLKGLWPPQLAPNPRTWILANLSHGRVRQAGIKLAAHRAADAKSSDDVNIDTVGGEVIADGVTVQYLAPMPSVHNVSIKAAYDANAFDIALLGGDLLGLKLQEGRVVLGGLSAPDQTAAITVKVAGPVSDVLRVIDSKPLGWAQALGVQPAKVKGEAVTSLSLTFPLLNNLTFDQVKVRAQAQTSQLSLPNVALGLDLTEGTLGLDVDAKGMDVAGRALLGGLPADIRWRENFSRNNPVRSRYQVSAILDDAARKTIGLDGAPFQPPLLSGPVPVDMTATIGDQGRGEIDIKAGLTQAVMTLPGLNWDKPASVVGQADALLRLAGGKLVDMPRFSASVANGLDVQGQGSFENGSLRRVTLARAKWGRSDLRGTIALKAHDGLAIDVTGNSFDAREIVSGEPSDHSTDKAAVKSDRVREKKKAEDLTPLSIQAKLNQVWVSDDGTLRNVTGSMARDRRDWQRVRIDGQVGHEQPLHVELVPTGGNHRVLKVGSTDAGAVLKALGVYDNLVGGKLEVNGSYDDADPRQPLSGLLTINDYQLVKAPALARLLTVAALTGIVDLLQGQGIHFSIMEAPFTLTDGVLELKDARASGTSLGLTAKGQIDLDRDAYALEGTVVPIYALNSVLGNIPVLGSLFSGEKGGGIFAMNYSMNGPASNPNVSVNPLSALTPGMFRKLFDIFDNGNETDVRPKDNTPPPAPDPAPDPATAPE